MVNANVENIDKPKIVNTIKSTIDNVGKLVIANRINQARKQIETIHHQEGFIVMATGLPVNKVKEGKEVNEIHWSQWSFKLNELDDLTLSKILGLGTNTYLSMNSFKSPKRILSNLRSLNCFWVDIDYYKITKYANKTPQEMIDIISKNKIIKKMPPSIWISSGRGLYAIWSIEDVNPTGCIFIYNRVMNAIYEEFEKYGADPQALDATRVLRLAGSKHVKANKKAEVLDNSNVSYRKYTLPEIVDKVLPKLQEQISNKKKYRKYKTRNEANKVRSQFNIYELYYRRLKDLQTLVEFRKGKMDGCRELVLFLYRYWSMCLSNNIEKTIVEIEILNNSFNDPLDAYELYEVTSTADKAAKIWGKKFEEYYALDIKPPAKDFFEKSGCYIYSNKKLIKLLKIQAAEEEGLKLLTIISTKEKNRRSKEYRKDWKRANRRNTNGLTPREQAKEDKIQEIEKLLSLGYKQVEISTRLDIVKSTVSKYVKIINERNREKEELQNKLNEAETILITAESELSLLSI